MVLVSFAVIALEKPGKIDATVNRQINFQGKIVLNSNSTNITNATYNMEFNIYSGGDGVLGGGDETLLWTEAHLRNNSQGVTITDGVFQVNLGAITTLPGSVDFNNSTLWLSMNLGNTNATCTPFSGCSGDGEMSPFVRFTAAPYAFNSDTLDGIDSAAFGQLSANNTWTGTQTLQPTTNITSAIVKQTSVGSPTADIFNIQTANSTSILQVTGPAANEAAVTLSSVGATRDLTLDSASGTLKLGSNTTTLQKSGTAFTFDVNSGSNSTLTVTNAGAGVGSLIVEGNITAQGGTITSGTSSQAGSIVISDGSSSTVTLTASGIGTNYSLTLPTAVGGTSQCLQTDSVTASQLVFSSCSAGGGDNISVNGSGATDANLLDTTATGTATGITFTLDTGPTPDTISIAIGNASATVAGSVTTGTQTFAGDKTFTGDTLTSGHLAVGSGASNSAPILLNLVETFDSSDNCAFGCYAIQVIPTIDNPTSPGRGVGVLSKVSTGASAFTLTEADGVLIQNATLGAGSAITTNVGLRIDNQTSGTSDYGISLGGADTADILFETDRTHILKVQDQDTAATVGSALQITGANGNTSGAGGDITISSGNGGGTGATNAGTITINSGSVSGAGTATINIGTTNTTALNLGNTSASGSTLIQGGNGSTAVSIQAATSGTILLGTTNANTISIGAVGTTANATTIHLADSTGNVAQTVTIGSAQSSSTTTIQAGSGNVNLSPSAGNDVVFSQGAGSNLQLSASAATTVDQLTISNASGATSTTAIDGASINFNTTGTTNSADNSGLRIDVTSNNNGTTTTLAGLKIGDLTSPEANATETGVYVGTGWDIGLDVQSGGLQLASIANPPTPSAGNLRVYAKTISGRTMLKGMGSSGVDYPYQPALFAQAISYQTPLTGATVSSSGQTWTVDTTASTPAASEVFGLSTNFATAATANDTTGISENIVGHYRGSVTNGANGFFYVNRMGLPDASYGSGATGARIWIGLSNQTSATMTGNDNPAGHYAGFQYSTNRGDGTWQFITKDGTTQSTPAAATGITFAQNKVYDFYLYTAPLGTTIYWRVDNITDGQTIEGSTTTNLPGTSTAMRAGTGLQTLTTTARNIRVLKQYVESDR